MNIRTITTTVQDTSELAFYHNHDTSLSYTMLSSKGGKRHNEDTCAVFVEQDGTGLFCVADGLGGHVGGKEASQTAIEAALEYYTNKFDFEHPESLVALFHYANEAIVKKQIEIPELAQMRSTMVVLAIKDSLAIWAHVGDVRLYHVRGGDTISQTKDHSVPQMLVDMGEIAYDEIRNHPDRSRLLNAMGQQSKIMKVSLLPQYLQLEKGDAFCLSSDGFWEWLSDEEICKALSGNDELSPRVKEMQQAVEKRAKQQDENHDNFSAICLRIKEAKQNLSYWSKTQFIEKRSKDVN